MGGDRLRLNATVEGGAHALLTTPAATKIYRSAGRVASQRHSFDVRAGGTLEWLPQETIFHDGARVDVTTRVCLRDDARFIGLDTFCLGLPARDESFSTGRFRQQFELWRDGSPILIERGRFDADDPVHAASWGLDGARVHALLVASPAPQGKAVMESVMSRLRALASDPAAGDRVGVTVLANGTALLCRYLGSSAERARTFLKTAWTLLRQPLLGLPAVPPRIWAT